jgi:two-component system nitrate/nitrite response regulator NarL
MTHVEHTATNTLGTAQRLIDAPVLLVSDVRIVREGLEQALLRRSVRVTAADADQLWHALRIRSAFEARVLVVDLSMTCALALARAVVNAVPSVRIVGFAAADGEVELMEGVEAGVMGFVSRSGSVDELVSAIECVDRGEAVVSPRVTAMLAQRLARIAAPVGRAYEPEQLTPRELEILTLIVDGLSNKEIAVRLCIELPTVKNHVHSILQKMHVRRRGEAAARHLTTRVRG